MNVSEVGQGFGGTMYARSTLFLVFRVKPLFYGNGLSVALQTRKVLLYD